MAAVTICSDFGAPKKWTLTLFPHLFPMTCWDQTPWSVFSECWVLSELFNIINNTQSWHFKFSLFELNFFHCLKKQNLIPFSFPHWIVCNHPNLSSSMLQEAVVSASFSRLPSTPTWRILISLFPQLPAWFLQPWTAAHTHARFYWAITAEILSEPTLEVFSLIIL